MLTGADEEQQLSGPAVRGPRHLRRTRRGRHAAPWRMPARPAAALVAARRRIPALAAVPPEIRRRAAVAAVIAVSAVGLSSTLTSSAGPLPIAAGAAFADDADRTAAAEHGASRDYQRVPSPSRRPADGASPGASPAAPKPAPSNTSAPPAAAASTAAPPAVPAPVGGLSQAEMNNAVAIVTVARQLNLSRRAAVVAIATALQESHLRNLANANLPQSLQHPNEGVGYDYDSVGLFQQRPTWGTVDQLMDPRESARRFYAALLQVPGWEQQAVTVAAQLVQRSAFPDAYAKWEALAQQIVDAIP
jgi:hypothetical protein